MPLLRKLAKLNRYERKAALEAMLLVPAVRLGLWVLPFKTLRRWVERVSDRSCARRDPATQAEIDAAVWAVIAVSQRVPVATCLTQALCAKVLLARRGWASTLRVGVARHQVKGFQAHAWLERDGQVLIGGTPASLQHYTALAHIREVRR